MAANSAVVTARRPVARSWFGLPPRKYFALLWAWTVKDFNARYGRSALQAVWALLQPFLFIGVYAFIFGVIFRQTGGELPYLSYLLAGMIALRLVVTAIGSNGCLLDNHHVIAQSYFPKEIIPLAQVLGALIDLAVTTVALLVIARLQGLGLPGTIVALPIVLVGVIALAAAACIAFATVRVFVRDIEFATVVIVQVLFFASPISYRSSQLPSGLRWLNSANPISVYVESLRNLALRGVWPDWALLGLHLVLSCGLLWAAIAHLRSIQHRIVDLG